MELLTVDATARMLKVAPITVRRYIAAGQLAAVKVGRVVRIRRAAVESLLIPIDPVRETQDAPLSRVRPFTMDDPLWDIVGTFRTEGPTDVSTNKHKYLADAADHRE